MIIFDKFRWVKVPNYNVTLRNFLYHMLLNKDKYKEKIENQDYSNKEINTFIYNCVIISINDFFYFERYYSDPKNNTATLGKIFNENLKLKQFDKAKIADEVPKPAIKMIKKFLYLKKDMSDKQINGVRRKINKILLTST